MSNLPSFCATSVASYRYPSQSLFILAYLVLLWQVAINTDTDSRVTRLLSVSSSRGVMTLWTQFWQAVAILSKYLHKEIWTVGPVPLTFCISLKLSTALWHLEIYQAMKLLAALHLSSSNNLFHRHSEIFRESCILDNV